MPDRILPISTTPGAITGNDYMDAVQDEVTGLWDRSCILLSSIGGTADAITATATPALTGALIGGMRFILPVASTNTTAATLKIGSGPVVNIVRNNGDPTEAGDLTAGEKIPLMYDATASKFYLMFGHTVSLGADLNYQVFTASGTWTKPAGISSDAWVFVEMWGGGGGGGANTAGGGGGGGAYAHRLLKASQLGATETVTVGAAGAVNGLGGNSNFGTKLTVYGGGNGGNVSNGGGGGGGGAMSAGSGAIGAAGAIGGDPLGGDPVSVIHSSIGGGGGGSGTATGTIGGKSWIGGGGGSSGGTLSTAAGGNSFYGGGGGGGGGSAGSAGGLGILNGGNGGAANVAGTAPGGGGGRNAVGARGEVRVMVVG